MTAQDVAYKPTDGAQKALLRNRGACCSEAVGLIGLVGLMAGVGLLIAAKIWLQNSYWEDGRTVEVYRDHIQIPVLVSFFGVAGAGLSVTLIGACVKGEWKQHKWFFTGALALTTGLVSYALSSGLLHLAARTTTTMGRDAYVLDKSAFDWALGIGGTAITVGGITAAVGLIGHLGLRNKKKLAEETQR
jgi:hypothetical protein